ncbi:MAG: DUF5989 family protein [Nibricoccus sp.]
MRRLKNIARLFSELWAFARAHKAWWIIPLVVMLLFISFLVVGVSTISPFIYSLF